MSGASSTIIKVINFNTNGISASVNIKDLDKIISLPQITAIAKGPSYIIGVMNFFGVIIPLVDLSLRIKSIKPHRYHIDTPVLVCHTGEEYKMGLIVQSIDDFHDIDHNMISRYELSDDKIYTGVIKYPKKLSLFINIDHVISDAAYSQEVEHDDAT